MVGAVSSFKLYWSSVRPKESLMMLGVPALGILFAEPPVTMDLMGRSALLLLCGLFVAGHVYTLNDLFGVTYDVYDDSKLDRPLQSHRLGSGQIWAFSILLGGIGYVTLYAMDVELFWITLSMTLLWMVYSLPKGLKGYPVVTSLVNSLGAGIMPFLIGYLFVEDWSWRAVLLSVYFGVIAGTGQLNREILDLEADSAAGLKTTAVWLGSRRTFDLSLGLFLLSAVFLLAVSWMDDGLPVGLGIAALLIQPFHIRAYRQCLAAGLSREALIRYIRGYRNLYALLGLAFGAIFGWRMLP